MPTCLTDEQPQRWSALVETTRVTILIERSGPVEETETVPVSSAAVAEADTIQEDKSFDGKRSSGV